MKQPALAKKVASLRIEKGLTQAKLADMCNVTVRTIQRIESAEVEPRSFTVKTIFNALGQEVYKGNALTSQENRSAFRDKLADLFNLKTNTMKKLMILSTPVAMAIAIFFIATSQGFAQNKVEKALAKANDNFVEAFNSGKMDAVKATYLESACSVPGPSAEICGSANIQKYFQTLYSEGFRFVDLKSNSVSVTDSVAIDKGIWTASIGGKKISGTYLTQWKLVDGTWKIENESSNVSEADVSSR